MPAIAMPKVRMFTALIFMGLALSLVVAWQPAAKEFALVIWTGACAMYRGEEGH
jgi:hypothetical protein